MARTFYHDCPFEYFFKLYGKGSDGKSVFTGLLTSLHGIVDVSNVSTSSLIDYRFALADLENKDVNVDTEISNGDEDDTNSFSLVKHLEQKSQKEEEITV